MERPACRSSPISVSLRARTLLSALVESMVKAFSAETCASKRVAICRERMTICRIGTFSKKEMEKERNFFFSPSFLIEITMSPRRCRPERAASWLAASISPSRLAPLSSTALYLNNIILQHALEPFGVERKLISALDRNFSGANQVQERMVQVHHPMLHPGFDHHVDFMSALFADQIRDRVIIQKKLISRDQPAGNPRDQALGENGQE